MKKIIPVVIIMTLLWSCGKKKQFSCSLPTVEKPANDSAIFFIPNAFSPNGDGLNDGFTAFAHGLTAMHMEIYNDNGELQYTITDFKDAWKPSMAFPNGLTRYYYQFEATTNQGHAISRCGEVYVYTCVPAGVSMGNFIFGDQYDPNTPEGYIEVISQEQFIPCKE